MSRRLAVRPIGQAWRWSPRRSRAGINAPLCGPITMATPRRRCRCGG